MLPLAPGRFSTTTAEFHRSPSFCPSVRARMSMPVPGVNGTMILMGAPGIGLLRARQRRHRKASRGEEHAPLHDSAFEVDIAARS
jgi:hypothetical protein